MRDAARLIGGVTLAVAAVVLFGRKSDEWAEFPLLLVLAAPCLLLYALGRLHSPALLVPAVLLTPLALLQLVDTLGGDAASSGNVAWVFALTAAVAAWCALRADLPYGVLLAGVSGIIAWLSFWDQALEDPSGNTFRWLLVLVAFLLAYVAVRVRGPAPRHSADLVTAAGIAAVSAGFLGIIGTAVQSLVGAIAGVPGTDTELAQTAWWDFFLLAVALALVVAGARWAARGPVYVGALGLVAFAISAAAQVAKIADRETPDHAIAGWPLFLLLLAGAALAVGFVNRDSEPPPPESPPPTEPLPAGPPVGSPGWSGDPGPR